MFYYIIRPISDVLESSVSVIIFPGPTSDRMLREDAVVKVNTRKSKQTNIAKQIYNNKQLENM